MTAGSWQRAGAVVALTVILWLLAGCSGGSQPAPPSPAPASPSASPTASTTPTTTAAAVPYKPADVNGPAQNVPKPVMPAEAKEFTEKGLEAFVRYWYTVYNYVVETADPTPGDPLMAPECSDCYQLLYSFKDAAAKGQWTIGNSARVDGIKPYFQVGSGNDHQALVQFALLPGQVVGPEHQVLKDYPLVPVKANVYILRFESGHWLISAIGKPVN
ncbi:DUF6318 family protein [Psychromicrobium xiongbiense]|uniref:DUF6318 family protein n=1 Tax=Psychromicrobium xiongbiense TaxID=3051184 RepID=UPI0025531874|nr:DUF6318 family protein [Psychromicrobium sp. YIM S02556]